MNADKAGCSCPTHRRLSVFIGGLISSTLLTLVLLPVLYRWFERQIEMHDTHAA